MNRAMVLTYNESTQRDLADGEFLPAGQVGMWQLKIKLQTHEKQNYIIQKRGKRNSKSSKN
jgi:hypothetical protein